MMSARKGLLLAAACVILPVTSLGWASAPSSETSHVADEGLSVLPGTLTNHGDVPVWVEYAGPGGENLQTDATTDKAGAWLVGPRTSCTWHALGEARPRVTTNPGLGNIWVTAGGYNEIIDGCSPTQ